MVSVIYIYIESSSKFIHTIPGSDPRSGILYRFKGHLVGRLKGKKEELAK